MTYEQKAQEEMRQWEQTMTVKCGLFNRMAKKVQNKINEVIPEKVRETVTEAIKKTTKITLTGSEYTTKPIDVSAWTLEEKEDKVKEKINLYKKKWRQPKVPEPERADLCSVWRIFRCFLHSK